MGLAPLPRNHWNYSETNQVKKRTQYIFGELMSMLDTKVETSHDLNRMYAFMLDSLIQENIKKDLNCYLKWWN
ncbi:flagellar protein FliS [Heliorestis convoluta]|uniref:flagellar protein FliS n=1 Tax=Heliorestis convoluta TaxID=356322 RepID=UPI00129B2427